MKKKYIWLFLICIYILFQKNSKANAEEFNFKYFSFENGLNTSSVSCISQDSRGFIWLGTVNGLYRYDGYSFVNYQFGESKISLTDILDVVEGNDGYIWIVSSNAGVYKYNTKQESIVKLNLDQSSGRKFSKISIVNDSLYVATNKGILVFKNPDANYSGDVIKCKTIMFHNSYSFAIEGNVVTHLYNDQRAHNKTLWVGTDGALFKYDIQKNTYIYVSTAPQYSIRCVVNFDAANVLVGSWDGGVLLIDRTTNKKISTPLINYINSVVGQKKVVSLLVETNKIWVATHGNGLYLFEHDANGLNSYKNFSVNNAKTDLQSDYENYIYKDRNGIIWVGANLEALIQIRTRMPGTELINLSMKRADQKLNYIQKFVAATEIDCSWIASKEGIYYVNKDFKVQFELSTRGYNGFKLPDNNVTQVYVDNEKNLWLTIQDKGLYLIPAIELQKLISGNKPSINQPIDANSIIMNDGKPNIYIISMFEDSRQRLWVSTWATLHIIENKKGYALLKTREELAQSVKSRELCSLGKSELEGFEFSQVFTIAEDNAHRIWIGTRDKGISVLTDNPKGGFTTKPITAENGLNGNYVNKISRDINNRMWVATNFGINVFDAVGKKMIDYSENNGLSSNYILDITLDKQGNIWAVSPYVITCFNASNLNFKNYYINDSYRKYPLGIGSVPISLKKWMLFASYSGFTKVKVNSINEFVKDIPLYFTDIRINNQRIYPGQKLGGTLVIENNINICRKITVPYNNIITLEFAALDFFNPLKTMYKYRIDGSAEWVLLTAAQRNIVLSNLPRGVHVVHILASNGQGRWNKKEVVLTISILPPFYLSNIAFLLYILLLGGIIFLYRKYTLIRLHEKSTLERERFERKKIEELDRLKIDFFTNISHEIRTPLTLIISPIDKLIHNTSVSAQFADSLKIIQKNSQRLLRLVNELMDFSKIENNQLKVQPQITEINVFVENICELFRNKAIENGVLFEIIKTKEPVVVSFDNNMIEKVIFNLLSNAFRFIPNNGSIKVQVSNVIKYNSENIDKEYVEIAVSDSGPGIPADKLIQIFDRYYQVENMQSSGKLGTGIGLSLVKSYIELHNGMVEVESKPNEETCFRVYLPFQHLENECYNEEDSVTEIKKIEDLEPFMQIDKTSVKANSHYKVLIVEDNEDIRSYIRNEFSQYFEIYEAENGEEGIQKTFEIIPDLIITDIIMPKVNGLELCKALKSNIISSHIPIIALSAKAEIENQIEGLNTGADVYIIKPFHIDYLKAQLLRLIEFKEKIYIRFLKETTLIPNGAVQNTLDDEFINNVLGYIENNIADPDLDVEQIAQQVKLSKVQAYRKIKAISGLSTVEFIRMVRLKKAAQLVLEGKLNYAEITYEIGFSSPSYFTKCFREHFGKTPSEFASDYTKE